MQTMSDLCGVGKVSHVARVKVRKNCELCGDKAVYKHTYLLEGMRNNPASSAYCKDDCSWCEDLAIFTCRECEPSLPPGYVKGSRFTANDRFLHLFLDIKEIDENDCYRIYRDGSAWYATGSGFQNLQESPAGFGETPESALAELLEIENRGIK